LQQFLGTFCHFTKKEGTKILKLRFRGHITLETIFVLTQQMGIYYSKTFLMPQDCVAYNNILSEWGDKFKYEMS